MRFSKKVLTLLFVLSLLTMGLVACGGSEPEPTVTPEPTAVPATSSPAGPSSNYTLTPSAHFINGDICTVTI